MKIVLGLLFLLVGFGCSSVRNSKGIDKDFENLAKDSCKCVNNSLKDLSPEMIEVIEDSNGSEEKLKELMTEYATSNPSQAMKDAQLMQGAMVDDITSCMSGLGKKYENVYTDMTEREVQKRLLEEFRNRNDCKAAYVFMKMGLAQ